MKVPGAAWVALIAVVTPWLVQYFGNTMWVEAAVIGLGAVASLIKVYSAPPELTARGEAPPSKVVRFLFG